MMKGAKAIVLATILTVAAVGQIVLAFVLYNKNGNNDIENIGWIIVWISALFGWPPIYTFKKYGGVAKGKSYVHTSVLVDKGIYAIVRHPQYLAGILIAVGLPLIVQHWLIGVLGAVAIVIYYTDTYREERAVIDKLGHQYTEYMSRVPRLNFIAGIIRLLRR